MKPLALLLAALLLSGCYLKIQDGKHELGPDTVLGTAASATFLGVGVITSLLSVTVDESEKAARVQQFYMGHFIGGAAVGLVTLIWTLCRVEREE